MNAINVILLAYLVGLATAAGCGTADSNEPLLGITTGIVKDADSGAMIYGAVYAGGSWSNWRLLDTANCDDFKKGETDYFYDFVTITDRWEGIALFNCETDGHAIESIYYWDGTDSSNKLGRFCKNILLDEFLYTSVACRCMGAFYGPTSDWSCQTQANGPAYNYFWLDQDSCPGITVTTQLEDVGYAYSGEQPASPACTGDETIIISSGHQSRYDNLLLFEQEEEIVNTTILLNQINALYVTIGILLVTIFILVVVLIKNKTGQANGYNKVNIQDSDLN